MLKIAVCDDNIEDLSNIVSIINDYIALHRDKNMITYTAFQNAVDLIAVMESGQKYDLVLLDILMPFLTGMEAAKEIRQFNNDVRIIFITSSSDFAVDSYSVDAYYYALKPMWKDKLIILLDKVISDMEIDKGTSFLVKSKTGLTRIYTNKLEFAEIIGKSLFYHFIDGSVIEAAGSMSEVEKELRDNPCFIKPHRSYIINMTHIDTISSKEIKMQSQILVPLARARLNTVKSTYLNFAFNKI
jgi:DNA-binding LytR/AlgR family response regulator